MKKEATNLKPKVKTEAQKDKKENKEIPAVEGKVGIMLREARLKKDKTVAEVAKELCIRKVYLQAIEDSNYDEIPDFPYGVGFVRSYAEYLKLNSNRMVQLFKEETGSKKQDKYFIAEPPVEIAAPNKKYLLVSLISIALIALAWLIFNQNHEENIQPVDDIKAEGDFPLQVEDYSVVAIPVEEPAPVIEDNVVVTDESFVEEAPAPEPEAIVPSGVVLKVNAESWVEVKDNEKLYISKVLKAGDVYEVPNQGKDMIYSVGKLGAVDVVINGQIVEVATPNKKTNIPLNPFLVQGE